jgi:DNA polymerase III epsilon subunit-like protein
MPPRALVFIDTETTGLHPGRRPWEIAVIRRHGDEQTRLHLCVDLVDLDLASADPAGLSISGFHRRHPQARQRPLHIPRVYPAAQAAELVDQWTADATVVGVVPRFDTECLAEMLGRQRVTPHWHNDVVDVVPLAVAAVRGTGRDPEPGFGDLSRQCGVKPPGRAARHTALGDARWAMRWYDKLTTGEDTS